MATKIFLPKLQRSDNPRVVNISSDYASIAGMVPLFFSDAAFLRDFYLMDDCRKRPWKMYKLPTSENSPEPANGDYRP